MAAIFARKEAPTLHRPKLGPVDHGPWSMGRPPTIRLVVGVQKPNLLDTPTRSTGVP